MKIRLLAFLLATPALFPLAGTAQSPAPPLVRENIEWADLWFPDIHQTTLPRILLIGDSITRQYYPVVVNDLQGKAVVCRFTTSYFVSNPLLPGLIKLYLGQMKFDVIQFNNGMHGWDNSEDQYRAGFPAFLAAIRDNAQGAKLIWADTTPVTILNNPNGIDPRTDRVKARNAIAHEFTSQAGIPEDDLFALMLAHPGLNDSGGVHFTKAGFEVEGHYVAALLAKTLGLPAPARPAP
jgi:hypothetical protein